MLYFSRMKRLPNDGFISDSSLHGLLKDRFRGGSGPQGQLRTRGLEAF